MNKKYNNNNNKYKQDVTEFIEFLLSEIFPKYCKEISELYKFEQYEKIICMECGKKRQKDENTSYYISPDLQFRYYPIKDIYITSRVFFYNIRKKCMKN